MIGDAWVPLDRTLDGQGAEAITMTWGGFVRALSLAMVLLWASPSFADVPQQQLPRFLHTAWGQDTSAPPSIWEIGQSPQGDLWLATGAGLYRFDGVRFTQFRSDGRTKLPSEMVVAMLVSRTGDIWTGYHPGGASRIRNGQITNYEEGPPKDTVKQFVQGRDDAIWVATFEGVAVFRHGRWTRIAWDPAYGRPFNMLATRGGVIWVAAQHALVRIDPVSGRVQKTHEPVLGSWAITEAPDGRIWFSDAATGLRVLDPAQLLRNDAAPVRKPALKANLLVPRRLLFDHTGVLWGIYEDGKGAFRILHPDRVPSGQVLFKTDTDQVYGASHGLTSDLAAALYQDRERNIWIGTNLGLDRFSATDIVIQRSIPLSTREGYRAVVTAKGRFYLADADTLYRFDNMGQPEVIRHGGLGHPNELCAGKSGRLWMAFDSGFARIDDKRLVPIVLPPGARNRVVLACAEDSVGGLWISVGGVGLFHHGGHGWRPITAQLPKDFFPRILVAGSDGVVWAADPNFDLFAIGKTGVRRYTAADGLKIGEIKIITTDDHGGVLAGGERGIARLSGGRFQTLTLDRYPALSLVSGLAQDNRGYTWLGTIRGVSRVSTKALAKAFDQPTAALDFKMFDYRDGLSGTPQQHCCHRTVFADGRHRIWLLTNRAVAWVDPGALSHNPVPPTVSIVGVTANNEPLAVRPGMRLMSDVRDLRIDFAAPSLVVPDRVRVRYRLWSVDADWVDPGARHQAFYTRLPPGHYRFSVIAANNDGVWNTAGATLDFTIPPTFFQSKTFLALIAVGLCLIGGGGFYLRLHFTARRISQRYEERLAERERIARELHDTLLQNVQALVLKFHSLINMLPNDTVRRHVEDAIDRAEGVVVESRQRIMDLRTAQSSEDLAQRLKIAADLPGGQTKPELRLTTCGEPRAMTPSVLDEITQIGSEAIRNAIRHSGGRLVEIEIAFEPSAFRLVVRDDGTGIPAGQLERAVQEGHYGFVGMCERARRLKGDLQVENRDGARVQLTVPARQAYEGRRGLLKPFLQRRRGEKLTHPKL